MATTWFDGVTVTLELAPDATPLTPLASISWTEITQYARHAGGITLHRGRSSELSSFAPGTLTVRLDNTTRVFDSSNTAGTFYGKLLPMKRIRWSVTYGGTTVVLFVGYVLGWPITYPEMTDSVVTIACVDAFHVAAQSELPGSAYAVEVLADSPAHYWPMQELTGGDTLLDLTGGLDVVNKIGYTTSTQSNVFPIGEATGMIGNPTTSTPAYLTQSDPLSPFPTMLEMYAAPGTNSGAGTGIRSYVSATDFFSIELHTDHVDVNYSHGGNRDTNGTNAGKSIYFTSPAPGSAYHAAVTASATTLTVYVNGIAVGTDTLTAGSYNIGATAQDVPGYAIAIGYAKGGSHAAVYTTTPSAARILVHSLAAMFPYGHPYGERTGTRLGRILDAISWPSADRDISTGETYCDTWLPAGDAALTGMRSLESAEQGLLFVSGTGKWTFRDRQWQMTNTRAINAQVTFGDTANVPYTDLNIDGNQLAFVRNTITVSYRSGSVLAKDATSRTAHGVQRDSVDAAVIKNSWLARQLANFRLRARKDPAIRVPGIEINMRANPGLATTFAVASLEIGDRVVVNRAPSGGSGSIAAKCQMQGVDMVMTADEWTVNANLAPAPKSYTEAPYLIAGGSSSASYVGVASGNLVPF